MDLEKEWERGKEAKEPDRAKEPASWLFWIIEHPPSGYCFRDYQEQWEIMRNECLAETKECAFGGYGDRLGILSMLEAHRREVARFYEP